MTTDPETAPDPPEPAQPPDRPAPMAVGPAPRRLRIAVVYGRLPFPMMRGDQMTIAHLLAWLAARGHSVDLYTLARDGSLTAAQSTWLARVCRRVHLYDAPRWRQGLGLLTALWRGWPFQVGLFFHAGLARDLRANVAEGSYDIVYGYYLRAAPLLPPGFGSRQPVRCGGAAGTRTAVFLALQLSQTLNTRRLRQAEPNPVKRLVYAIEARRLRRHEARAWAGVTRTVLIGPADRAAVDAACRAEGQPPIDNAIQGAHGTDLRRFHPPVPGEPVPGRIVFSGAMAYRPNVQAVLWFVEGCWPLVLQAAPDATLVIVGRDPGAAVRRLGRRPGITVTGTVPDPAPLIRSAAVCIDPMQAAGGMQNKLIEYLACARPVVATSMANEGIGAPVGTALEVADDPVGFAAEVVALLREPERAARLGRAGRDFVARHWTWEDHFARLEAAFLDTLDGPG